MFARRILIYGLLQRAIGDIVASIVPPVHSPTTAMSSRNMSKGLIR